MVTKSKWVVLAQAALLSAIIILMAFTPVGYLKIGMLEITFICIPVAVGAIVLGPAYGAFFGALFGITSFIQCFGFSAFGTVLFGINPFYTFLICFFPRVIMGFLCGLIFKAVAKFDKKKIISYFAGAISAPILNTVLYMTLLMLLFGTSEVIQENMAMFDTSNYFIFVVASVGLNALVEAIACTAITFALVKSINKFIK